MPDDKRKNTELPHNVILEGRARTSLSGVMEVESFDEAAVSLYTTQGLLIIRGNGLHVESLCLETGELQIEGMVDSMQYLEETRSGGFFSRLFK